VPPGGQGSGGLPYLAYRTGARVATALPEPVIVRGARAVARGAGIVQRRRRFLAERHARRVQPGLRGVALHRAANAMFDSYGRYWAELFRLHEETPEAIEAAMSVEGLDHLDNALALGRGVILALPHLGGWDFGGAWMAVRGYRPVAVAEVLEPVEMYEWFVEVRERLGMEIVAADAEAGPALVRALKAGRVVGLVSDRDILGSGVEVEFFGERTTLPAGPAMLALRTGAALIPAAIYFTPGGHHSVISPPLEVERHGRLRDDVARVTQVLAGELEALIRRAPDQWHLLQPNWPSDQEALARSGRA